MHPIIREMQVIGQEAQLLALIDNHCLYAQYKNVVFQRLLDAAHIVFLDDATNILNIINGARLYEEYRTITMLGIQLYQNHFDTNTMLFDKKEMTGYYSFLRDIKLLDLIEADVSETNQLTYQLFDSPIYLCDTFGLSIKHDWLKSKSIIFLSKLAYSTILQT